MSPMLLLMVHSGLGVKSLKSLPHWGHCPGCSIVPGSSHGNAGEQPSMSLGPLQHLGLASPLSRVSHMEQKWGLCLDVPVVRHPTLDSLALGCKFTPPQLHSQHFHGYMGLVGIVESWKQSQSH